MSTDEYVPSDDDVRSVWVVHERDCGWAPHPGDPSAEFDRFLARVRRDAAREQFENFIANTQTMYDGTHLHAAQIVYAEVIRMAEVYVKAYFPEETP